MASGLRAGCLSCGGREVRRATRVRRVPVRTCDVSGLSSEPLQQRAFWSQRRQLAFRSHSRQPAAQIATSSGLLAKTPIAEMRRAHSRKSNSPRVRAQCRSHDSLSASAVSAHSGTRTSESFAMSTGDSVESCPKSPRRSVCEDEASRKRRGQRASSAFARHVYAHSEQTEQ